MSPRRSIGPGPKAGIGERLVYENILGTQFFSFPAGAAGDDLQLTSADGCLLSRLEFQVSGGPGESSPFSVGFALYDECPLSGRPPIAGTEGQIELPDNGPHWVTLEPPPEVELPISRRLWLRLSFSRLDAGWIGGTPALEGHTDASYFEPFFGGCNASVGFSFPEQPYSGINARVFVREPCDSTFIGFRVGAPTVVPFLLEENGHIAEDIELHVDDCQLVSYEVGIRGEGSLDLDLRVPDGANDGLPGAILPATGGSLSTSINVVQLAQVSFDPPVSVPRRFWITLRSAGGAALPSLVRTPPAIGNTEPTYAHRTPSGWERRSFPNAPVPAALFVSFTCAGEAMRGACCDMFQLDVDGEAVCREIPRINCVYPPRDTDLLPEWIPGETCAPEPFNPPCGRAACCRPHGLCENATERECARNSVSWTRGVYCEGLAEPCEFVCVPSFDSCTLAHEGTGCRDPFCCREVCQQTAQDFCCVVTWDDECVAVAAEVCDIPPDNDECAPVGEQLGAKTIIMPGSSSSDGVHATESESDPGFCCHEELPGQTGFGTVWYKFVATGPTAELTTCRSSAPAADSLIQVFAPQNSATPALACATLESIGCDDNQAPCGRPENSRLCLTNLVAGQTYYAVVASKSQATRGSYILDISTTCQASPSPPCPCPLGEVQWLAPQPGTMDARRPHPAGDAGQKEGIASLAAMIPPGSRRLECWSSCETSPGLPLIAVSQIVESTGGVASIVLNRPITAGAATTVSYVDAFMTESTTMVFSHPGNINGDAFVDAADVASLVEIVGGTGVPIWGSYSADINRSERVGPLDLLEAIDLLNGAEQFVPWNGTERPDPTGICP